MWIEIAEADVVVAFSGKEMEAIRGKALKDGQADPISPAIADVVNDVRGYVGASGRWVLGAGLTVPEALKKDTLALIAEFIPARVGMSAGEARVRLADAAREKMKMVAAGKFALQEPETPAEAAEQTSAGTPSFSGRARRNGRAR